MSFTYELFVTWLCKHSSVVCYGAFCSHVTSDSLLLLYDKLTAILFCSISGYKRVKTRSWPPVVSRREKMQSVGITRAASFEPPEYNDIHIKQT